MQGRGRMNMSAGSACTSCVTAGSRASNSSSISANSSAFWTSPLLRGSSRAMRALFEIEERAQLLRTTRVTQLAQRLRLDLTDAFTSHVELLADFLERVVGVHVDAETHAQHLRLARREAAEHVAHGFVQARARCRVDRRLDARVLDEIAETRILVVADGSFHRDG